MTVLGHHEEKLQLLKDANYPSLKTLTTYAETIEESAFDLVVEVTGIIVVSI